MRASPTIAPVDPAGNDLAAAVESMSRTEYKDTNIAALVSQRVHLTYFTPKRPTPISRMLLLTGGTAAGATPTLCRAGYYEVTDPASGDLELACAIANDTSLFAATFTEYLRNLSAGGGLPTSYTFLPGRRYASALLVVSAAAIPGFYGNSAGTVPWTRSPRICGAFDTQPDLPLAIPGGSVSFSTARIWTAGLA